MKNILLLFIITFCFPCISDSTTDKNKPANYCHEKESWEQYHDLLAKYPDDDQIYSLYALRIGLCTMVEAGTISQNRAVDIFERMRKALIRYYEENKEPKKGA